MKSRLQRYARPATGVVVTALFLWLLFRGMDMNAISDALSRVSAGALLLALAFLGMGYTARIARWWWMLRALDPGVRLGSCGWPFLVSIALNNILPFRAGDATRVVAFRQHLRAPGMRLLGTLVIERLLDLLILLAIFFIGLRGTEGQLPVAFVRLAAVVTAAAVLTLAAVVLFSRRVEALVRWLFARTALADKAWARATERHAAHFLEVLGILRDPRLALQLIAFSVVAWGFEGAMFATIAAALDIQTASGGPWFALSTGTLATILPSTPGYIGTFDYFAVLGLSAYGVPRESAAAFAVVVHLVLWLPLTVAGLAYFLKPGARSLFARERAEQLPVGER